MSYENKGTITPKYIVSSYGDGNYNTTGTSDEAEINQALSDLTSGRTWQEKILLKGNFNISDIIIVPAYTFLELDGKVTLANSRNCDMVRNENWQSAGDDYITIQGGTWNQNKDNQTGGGVFAIEGINGDETQYLKLRDVYLRSSYDEAVHINQAIKCQFHKIHISVCDSHGFYFQNVSDSWMGDLKASTVEGVGYMQRYGAANNLYVMYLGGASSDAGTGAYDAQMYLENTRYNKYVNVRINYTGVHGLRVNGGVSNMSEGNQFTNIEITNQRGTANTWDAILLEDFVSENQFHNVYVDKMTGNNFRYGWNESGVNSDYNKLLGALLFDCQTNPTQVQGANSEAAHFSF